MGFRRAPPPGSAAACCFSTAPTGSSSAPNSVVEGTTSRSNTGNEIAVGANSLVLHNVVEGTVVGGTRIENVCNPACP